MCLSFWTVFVSGKGNFSIVNDSNHAPCRFHFSTNVLPVYEKIALFANEWLRIRYQTSISGRFWLNNIHSYSEMLKHNRRGTATETYLDGFSIDWFIMEVSTTIV